MAGAAACRNLHCITKKHRNEKIITGQLRRENVATSKVWSLNSPASPQALLCIAWCQQCLLPHVWVHRQHWWAYPSSSTPSVELTFCLIEAVSVLMKWSDLQNNQTKVKKQPSLFLRFFFPPMSRARSSAPSEMKGQEEGGSSIGVEEWSLR